MADTSQRKKLSKMVLEMACSPCLRGTHLGDIISNMPIKIDAEADLPPDVVDAILLMLRVADKTPIGHPGDGLQFLKTAEFLQAY